MELATVLYSIGAHHEYKGSLLLLRLQPKGQSFVNCDIYKKDSLSIT